MILVVDANVVVKWFVEEPLRDEAMSLLRGTEELHAPDLLALEVANVVVKKVQRREMTAKQAHEVAQKDLGAMVRFHSSRKLLPRALEIAITHKHSIYDSLYAACADYLDAPIVTDDRKFAKAFKSTPLDLRFRMLSEADYFAEHMSLTLRQIRRLVEMAGRMKATRRFVYGQLIGDRRDGHKFKFVDVAQMEPYFRSPALRSVQDFVSGLTPRQQADVLALGWWGRGTESDDWPKIRMRALGTVGSHADATSIDYVVAQMESIERGYAKFQALLAELARRLKRSES